MKIVIALLLTCFLLPLPVEAKSKSKHSHGGSKSSSSSSKHKSGAATTTGNDTQTPAAEGGVALITTELGGRDLLFFTKTHEIGALETWLGEQAKTKGEADKVKAVGDALQSTQ